MFFLFLFFKQKTAFEMRISDWSSDVFSSDLVYYQWKGSYTVAQMSDEVRRVEVFLDANREKFHIKQIYSWFSEQGDAGTQVTFDSDDPDRIKALTDQISEALPKSARAEIGV